MRALLDYCAWEWGDKQKLAKVDAISNQHNEALVAMGVIEKAPELEREDPELPDSDLYWRYRRLKFGIHNNTLYGRDRLTFGDVESYARLVGWRPNPNEVGILMDIDAIFEAREIK